MGVMKGDVVGEGDVVVGGDAVGRIVEMRHLGWSVFVGGETTWEDRGHKRRHHWRGRSVVGGEDAIGGEALLEETS